MGYKNTSTLAYEVERALVGDYNIHAHGDLGAFYKSISNADLPGYTALFYHPSDHESLSEFRYSRIQVGYDPGLKHTREIIQGNFADYAPLMPEIPDGVGKGNWLRKREEPKKEDIEEIAMAQEKILQQGIIITEITATIRHVRVARQLKEERSPNEHWAKRKY